MKANHFVTVKLDQFQSARNLSPRLAQAKEDVERMQQSMADLAAKDGDLDDFDPAQGRVRVETSHRWECWNGPRSLHTETGKFDPKTNSCESYERTVDMESPYGDTGMTKGSFHVDQQGREHYAFFYEFCGSTRENSQIVIDRSGNLVQFSE